MRTLIPSNLLFASRGILFVLILLTPVLFTSSTVEGFEFPKMVFIYILGSTASFLFFLGSNKPIIKPAAIPTVFILSYILATLLSTHMYTSLWGYYSRFNGGLVSFLIYFGLYVTTLNVLQRADLDKLKSLMILSSVPVSVYGLFQFVFLTNEQETVRIFSTLGQANWLGAYLAFCALISLNYAFRKTYWKVYFSTYLLAFSCLWLTFSVSSLLGFIAGSVVFAVHNHRVLAKEYKRTFFAFVISLLVIISVPGIWRERLEDVTKSIALITKVYAQENRQFKISDSGLIRQGMWVGSIDIILSSPKTFLFGTGPETFAYEFQKHRPPFLNYTSEWEYILNKPHNYYLEIWATCGLFAFLAYLTLLFKLYTNSSDELKPALLALYITNIFSWPTTVLNLYVWILFANENTK